VKLWPVLSDTGRVIPGSSSVNLLNAGWTATTAAPLPAGGWTIPDQALTVFIEAPWDQLNRLHDLVVRLVDDEGQPAYFMPGPNDGGPEVRIEHQVVVGPVPGAPNGTPGLATLFIDLPLGSLWIPAPRKRYIWQVSTGNVSEEIGFWVQTPPQQPVIGGSSGTTPVQPG
jgi:hypothetical protein